MLIIWRPLITGHSIVTTLVLFSLLALACGLLVRRSGWSVLRAVGVAAALVSVRLALPASLPGITKYFRLPDALSRFYAWAGEPLWGPVSPTGAFLALWACGTLVTLTRLGLRLWNQRRVVPSSIPTFPTNLGNLYETTLWEMHCHKYGALLISDAVSTAMVIGFFTPDILFPSSMVELDEEQQKYILRHEITHFMHHDLWIKLGLELACCLLWWNPAVYVLRTGISQFLELRCDACVCRDLNEEQVIDYSQTLIQAFHRQKGKDDPVAVGYLGRPGRSRVRQRFLQMLTPHSTGWRERIPAFLITLAAVVLFLGSYSVEFVPAGAPSQIEEVTDAGFILRHPDGTLEVYGDMVFYGTLSPQQMEQEPFASLPVVDAAN